MADCRIYVKSSTVADGRVGWGAIINTPQGEVWELTGEGEQTVNRSTLQAIVNALALLPKPATVRVFTDMKYIAEGFSNTLDKWTQQGWKRKRGKGKASVAHPDLWAELVRERSRHKLSVDFITFDGMREELSALAEAGREGEAFFRRKRAVDSAPETRPAVQVQFVEYANFRANLDAYLLQATEREIRVACKSGRWVSIRPCNAPTNESVSGLGKQPRMPCVAKDVEGVAFGGAKEDLPWEDA